VSQGSRSPNDRLSVGFALGAAALFGISAPASKALLAVADPWLIAGLLYLGSGVSLNAYRAARALRSRAYAREAAVGPHDWGWLAAAILTGGLIAPVLLKFGLSRVSAAEAEHHQHDPDAATPPGEPHSHRHTHEPLRHRHPHSPDIHHRHGH
jgi:hypothetical protein